MKNVFRLCGFFAIIAFLSGLFGCHSNPLKVNLNEVHVDLQFKSLDDKLYEAKSDLEEQLPEIQSEFKDFLPIFTYQMIRIGGPDQPDYINLLQSFLSDTLNVDLKKRVDQTINKVQIKNELTEAFRYYHYYFPAKLIPAVYTCVSGFNQSIVMTDSLIGISLDKYLGEDCEYYPQLGIPGYKVRNMIPEKIVPDVVYAWGMSEFPFENNSTHLIDRMIYEGKLLYYMDAMLPDMADSVKIGFTQKQLDFCNAREEGMWTYLAEHKLLFSTERMDIKRYIDDSPYTSSFTADSPGKTGAWLGWQIVRAYMKNNKGVGLAQLMEDENYQGILSKSGYQPGK